MGKDESEYRLRLGIPNGIVLSLIGMLVLVTPLTIKIPENQLAMDLIAGAALVIGGLVSFISGWKNR